MFSKIFFHIPGDYKSRYTQEKNQKNIKHLTFLGFLMAITQVVIYLSSMTNPFSEIDSVIRSYHAFYGMSIALTGPTVLLMYILNRRYKEGSRGVQQLVYPCLFFIMTYVMGTAIFDQFQGEDVVFYYTMMFIVAIVIDLSVAEHAAILLPIQLIFIAGLLSNSDALGDVSGLINDSSQYLLMSMIVNYYINELQKKNFVQRQMLMDKNSELEFLSYYDPLSGLHNRRRWEALYYDAYQKARDNNVSLAVLVIDIDYFKQYNDNYGHVAGDEVIRMVSKAFQGVTEGLEANVGRYGGDEFAIAIYDIDEVQLRKLIREIRSAIAYLDIVHEHTRYHNRLSLSVGSFVGVPSHMEHPWSMVVAADKVLYKEKENRKYRYLDAKEMP